MKIQENYNYFLDGNKEVTIIWKKFDKACVLKVGTDYPTAIVDIDRLSGIPLTEEWLLKLGFEKRGIIYEKFVHELENLFIGKLTDYGFAYYVDKNDSQPLVYVKYVHPLQNLFYSLTNQELS